MKRVLGWFLGILCMFVIAAIVFPFFASGRPGHGRIPTCLSNLKQSSTSMQIYIADYDDRFPRRDEWTNVLYPYAKNWNVFHCPKVPKWAWGFAFNVALDRAKQTKLDDPSTMPMLYDSVNLIKNASDLVTSLPLVPRHERNTMGYADGHAKSLKSSPR